MSTTECPREHDVMDAIASGRWPHRCDADLRSHIESCDLCSDLAEVVVPMRADVDHLLREARVPTAGVVWWRAQLRARLEAEAAAARPIRAFTAIALACAAGLVGAVVSLSWPWIRTWLWAQGAGTAAPEVSGIVSLFVTRGVPLLGAVALVVVAAPLALLFALSDRHRATR